MTSTKGSSRARSAAIRLLGWYPRPWKRRYLVEMRALLEQMPVRWRQVANLAVMAVREWCSPRALGWPARSAAGRVQVVRAVTYFTIAFALDGIARVIAWKIRAEGITIIDSVSTTAAMLLLAVAIRTFAAQLQYERHKKKYPKVLESQRRGLIGGWEIVLWACLLFPYLVVRHAEPIPAYLSRSMVQIRPFIDVLQVFVWTNVTLRASAQTKRLARVQRSVNLRNLGYRRTPPFTD